MYPIKNSISFIKKKLIVLRMSKTNTPSFCISHIAITTINYKSYFSYLALTKKSAYTVTLQ